MQNYFVLFIVLSIATPCVLSAATCVQLTNAEIPKDIQSIEQIAKYADEGMICVQQNTFKDIGEIIAKSDLVVQNLVDEAIKTGEAKKLVEETNAEEVHTSRDVIDAAIAALKQKEKLFEAAISKIEEKASGLENEDKITDQIDLLRKISRVEFNNVFLIATTAVLKLISVRYSYSVAIVQLLNCKRCGNTKPYIKKQRNNEKNFRRSIIDGTIQKIVEFEQSVSIVLDGFEDIGK